MKRSTHKSILDYIDQWYEERPNDIALRYGNETLTFGQLHQAADLLADRIAGQQIDTPFVGLSTTKSIWTIVGMVAIVKSGKTYLPLDPNYPSDRIHNISDDSGVSHIVCLPDQADLFRGFQLKPIPVDSITCIKHGGSVDSDSSSQAENELIGLLYTSGSTGVPKGVCLTHAGMYNVLSHQLQKCKAAVGSQNLLFTNLTFDVSFDEIFTSLASGGTLHIIDDTVRLDANRLLTYIDQYRITRITVPYVVLQYLAEAAKNTGIYPESLAEVITGGELVKITPAIRSFFTKLADCTLMIAYGPTETSIWVTELRMTGNAENWPEIPTIGSPISNTSVFFLDDNRQVEVQPGEVGEICIGGPNVTKGYLNNAALTAKHFIDWKDKDGKSHRLYCTGDLGRLLPNGEIVFFGRKDNQVKIRGNRVELGEIEVRLAELPQVVQCAVVLREDTPGIKRLVAYVVAPDGGDKEIQSLRDHLHNKLPSYMVPDSFVWLEALPRTTTDKVDRNALPIPQLTRQDTGVLYRKPTTTNEQRITELWANLLLLDKVGLDDNFFSLGGNSLFAQKTIAELHRQYGITVPVTRIYQYPTAAQLARALDETSHKPLLPKMKPKKHPRKNSRVAVIGMAGKFPGAPSVEELWNLLRSGKEGIKFFSNEELDESIPGILAKDPNYIKARGIIEDAQLFDEKLFGITPTLAKLMDPQQRLFLEICRDVLESAGYLTTKSSHVIGVYAGCGNNTYFINNLQHHPEEIAKIGEFQVTLANEKDYLASRTAYHLDLKGPAVNINTACSTSLVAIAQAVEAIRAGQCDMAIAGGISITVPIHSGQRHEEGAMFSKDGHTRSFDAQATGTVFSDGGAVVLLKPLELAEAEGDTIYAVINGIGISNDGGGKGSFMAPSAVGQATAIQMAMQDANIAPETINYIEAHGTATPLGDPIEIEGLKLAFGEMSQNQFCRIGSLKSNLGHLTHAAGVAGLIKVALSLHHKVIPPTINFEQPNPDIDFENSPFLVNSEAFSWTGNQPFHAGVSSMGVGGTNAHVLLESYEENATTSKEEHGPSVPILVNWSSVSAFSGESYAGKLADFLYERSDAALQDVAFTLQTTREQLRKRYITVAENRQQLIEKLKKGQWEYFELKEPIEQLVFMFPGQGAQYPNMGDQLYKHEPVYRAAIDACAEILVQETGEDFRTLLFTYDAQLDDKRLYNTYYTQPALFMTSYAMAQLWMSWGIRPTAFIGHSVGEYVAAHLAGIFSLKDALKMIVIRGRLSSAISHGSMLSVYASVHDILPKLPPALSVAAINSPEGCVIAGPTEIVFDFERMLEAEHISCKPLKTSHAFHSHMMYPIVGAFMEELQQISLHVPRAPIVSTVTGEWLKDEEATDRSYWANHITATVRFSDAIRFIERELHPMFLDIGPSQVTATLTKQHGESFATKTFASFPTNGSGDWLIPYRTLGLLWTRGVSPNWTNVYRTSSPKRIAGLPTYVYDRKTHWVGPKKTDQIIQHTKTIQDTKQPVHMNARKDLLIQKVKTILINASGIDITDASPQTSFVALGFDSLLMTQIAQTLKQEFGLPITFRQLNEEYSNLERLSDYLDKNLPETAVKRPEPSVAAEASVIEAASPIPQQFATNANTAHPDAISLISQQISLISQQIALLQQSQPNAFPMAVPQVPPAPVEYAKPLLPPTENSVPDKPFGATARIDKNAAALDEQQSKYLDSFIEKYTSKTAGSKAYTQRHRSHMADPRAVSGFKPTTKELVYPIVTNRSKGCRLWDIDGNEYIDALNGFGSSMLGYQPDFIVEALHRQIDEGFEIGPQHQKAGEVCQLICELTQADRAALCNTGSEAVLGAMRIARTVTGRSTIVAFTNSYHGIVDEVIVRGTPILKSFPAAPGIMPESVQNMLILDYGTEESLRIIREKADELAAVLVEPVQSRRPEFQPIDFLKEVRRITGESGAALIFDEVVTGFRMHLGGMQQLWGIQADIATYGKVVGSGISMGIIAGKKAFMDALDGGYWEYGNDSVPESGVTYFAGTFVRHPLALAMAKATLSYLKSQGPQLQENLTNRTKAMVDELNSICQRYGTPIYIAQFGSLWKLKYHEEFPYSELIFAEMRLRGIHILDLFPCYLTTAHSDEDIRQIISAFERSIHELVKQGIVPSTIEFRSEHIPPVPNARLGKDKEGNPAWFIIDENHPGQYLQVTT